MTSHIVRLTPEETASLPPGFPVAVAEKVFGRFLAESRQHAAADAAGHPGDVAPETHLTTGVRVAGFPQADLMKLWARVAARLETDGATSDPEAPREG